MKLNSEAQPCFRIMGYYLSEGTVFTTSCVGTVCVDNINHRLLYKNPFRTVLGQDGSVKKMAYLTQHLHSNFGTLT